MGGTKIFVLQIRDLLKAAVFAVIGLVVLVLLVYLFMPRQNGQELPVPTALAPQDTALFSPGTYTASIILNDRPLEVMVTVTEYEITSIEMSEMYESQRMLFPLFEPIMARVSDDILFYQSIDIVIYNDYPVTTGILQQAVAAALDQATLR